MSDLDENTFSVKILDRDYKVKCPAQKVNELKTAAMYLDGKMREVQNSGKVIGAERVAVITALNISHELLGEQRKNSEYVNQMSDSIKALQSKINAALTAEDMLETN